MTRQYDYYHHTIYDLATIYDFQYALPVRHAPTRMPHPGCCARFMTATVRFPS